MLEITLLTLYFNDKNEWLEQRVFVNVETNDFSFCFVSFLSSKEENQYMLKNLQIDEKEKINFIQYKFFKNDIFSFKEIKEQVILFLNKFDFKRWNNFQKNKSVQISELEFNRKWEEIKKVWLQFPLKINELEDYSSNDSKNKILKNDLFEKLNQNLFLKNKKTLIKI